MIIVVLEKKSSNTSNKLQLGFKTFKNQEHMMMLICICAVVTLRDDGGWGGGGSYRLDVICEPALSADELNNGEELKGLLATVNLRSPLLR